MVLARNTHCHMNNTNDIKVGDIITGYFKGYFKVTSIVGDIVEMTKISDTEGKVCNGKKEYICNIAFCKRIDLERDKQQLRNKIERLEKLQILLEEQAQKMVSP